MSQGFIQNGGGASPALVQGGGYISAVDSGAVNAYVGAYAPAVIGGSYTDGMILTVTNLSASNTGAATFNAGVPGAHAIKLPDFSALVGSEMVIGNDYNLQWNNHQSAWILLNSSLTGDSDITVVQVQSNAFNQAVDSGVADHYVVALSPAPLSLYNGLTVFMAVGNTNLTNSPLIDVNTFLNVPIVLSGGAKMANNDLAPDVMAVLRYSVADSAFILENPVSSNLSAIWAMQNQNNAVADTGAANAYVAAASFYSAINGSIKVPYMPVYLDVLHVNSGASTFAYSDIAALPIHLVDGSALVGGEMQVHGISLLVLNNAMNAWLLLNPFYPASGVTPLNVQDMDYNKSADTGAVNAYLGVYSPAIVSGSYVNGQILTITALSASNTGAATFNAGTPGALPILLPTFAALAGSEMILGGDYNLQYSAVHTSWILLNSSLAPIVYPTALQVQSLAFNSVADSGAVNAYVGVYSPVVGALVDGQMFTITNLSASNTGAATFDAGTGVHAIKTPLFNALVGNEMLLANDYNFQWNANQSAFILLNSSLAPATPITATQVQQAAFNEATDSGVVNAYVGAYSPAVTGFGGIGGVTFVLNTLSATNTGAATFDNGAGAKPVVTPDLSALVGSEMVLNNSYQLMYNAFLDSYVLLNSSSAPGGGVTGLQVQNSVFNLAADSGAVNAYAGVYSPAISANTNGQILTLKLIANTNTGASTFQAGTAPVQPIILPNFAPLVGNEMQINNEYILMYNAFQGAWILINSTLPVGASTTQVQEGAFNTTADTGVAANAYAGTYSPNITVIANYNGVVFSVTSINASNTGASTYNVNGLGGLPIITPQFGALVGGEMIATNEYLMMYSSVQNSFVLLNSSLAGGGGGGVTSLQVQDGAFNTSADGGALNAYVGTYTPTPVGFPVEGTIFTVTNLTSSNTGAATFNNGTGAFSIFLPDGTALIGGEMLVSFDYNFQWNGNVLGGWILLNSSIAPATGTAVQAQAYTSGTDTGAVNAYAVALSPALGAYVNNMLVEFTPTHSNTISNPTLALNGLTAHTITVAGGNPLLNGDLSVNTPAILQYKSSGTKFVLLNPQTLNTTSLQQNRTNVAGCSGSVNAYVSAYTPVISSLALYEGVIFTLTNITATNTGASTFNAGSGALPIKLPNFAALSGGELVINNDYAFQYNANQSSFILLNSSITAPTSTQIQAVAFNKGTDTGTLNTYVSTFSPAVVTLTDGLPFRLLNTQHANTGTSTLNVNGTAVSIVLPNGNALTGGEMLLHGDYDFIYNNVYGQFILQNSSLAPIVNIVETLVSATGAYTYVPTAGVQFADFELQGDSGGTGNTGGSAGAGSCVGATGCGAYLKIRVSGAANLAAVSGNIGAGGIAGAIGGNNGGDGAGTSLTINGGTTYVAGGSPGTPFQTASASAQWSNGGTGGVITIGTNGTLLADADGIQGGNSTVNASGGSPAIYGMGANGFILGFGKGQSGAFNGSGTNLAGMAGVQGAIRVTEYIGG